MSKIFSLDSSVGFAFIVAFFLFIFKNNLFGNHN